MAFNFDIFVIFFIIATCLNSMAASDDAKDDGMDKGAHSERGALWFGPRLGKRSLQYVDEDQNQAVLRLLEAADIVKYYFNQMPIEMQADAPRPKVTKKIIFTPKLGRSLGQPRSYDKVEFTPRLGRKLAERITPSAADEESYRSDRVIVNRLGGNPFFSPRLGRNYDFSPRLGRDLIYDLETQPQIRVERSANKTDTD